ncbi:UNVERIFIED_CONTAM: hypothetical protein HDU68_000488 [Siphonaria sp. JEL0065]|nr:hypothetical protein HDU68_000488 [Siphonaria sp. JEL0065]
MSESASSHHSNTSSSSVKHPVTNTAEFPHYLLPSFDPQRATVPELKSILLNCGIEFPTHRALKDEYVALFQEKVAPNVKSFLASLKNVKPSNTGIKFVHTSPLKTQKRVSDENVNLSRVNPVDAKAAEQPQILRDSENNHRESNGSCALEIVLSGDEDSEQEHQATSKPRPAIVKALPQPLPVPPQNPQSLLHPSRLDTDKVKSYLVDLPPPLFSQKNLKQSLSLKASRLPKPASRSRSSGPSSPLLSASGCQSHEVGDSPQKKLEQTYHYEFTSSSQAMAPIEANTGATSSTEGSVQGESIEASLADDEGGLEEEDDSDYSDVLDAYENIPSPAAAKLSTPKPSNYKCPGKMANKTDDEENEDVRFSPDPRRSSSIHRDRRSTSPRSSTSGSVVQSTGSPLLTKHLKQRLHQNVMETVRRRSSLRGDEIRSGRNLSLIDAIKAVESDNFDETDDGEASDNQGGRSQDTKGPLDIEMPDPGNPNNIEVHETVKHVRFPCIMLFFYALLVPPLFMLITWYLDTGSTIEFCKPIVDDVNQFSEVVTAKDLMNYLMPSCIPCLEGAICEGDRVVACVLDELGEVSFDKAKPFRAAFRLGSLCEDVSVGRGKDEKDKNMYPKVSIQVGSRLLWPSTNKGQSKKQPTYSRTQPAAPSATISLVQKDKVHFDRVVPIVQNVTHQTLETIMKVAQGYLLFTNIAFTELSANFLQTSHLVLDISSEKLVIAKKYWDIFAFYYNTLTATIATKCTPSPADFLYYSTISIISFLSLFAVYNITTTTLAKTKKSIAFKDIHIARIAANEILTKLQDRAAKIRRQSILSRRKIDVSVRLDQVKDLVLPTNPQRQRRLSRGGDVDEKALLSSEEGGLNMLDQERRENVWKLVREIVLDSGVVEEMEVDGVSVWLCN